jgi:integrase
MATKGRRRGTVERYGRGWSIRFRDPGGRTVREAGFATKRLAEEALTDRLGSLQRGAFVRPQRLSVAEYLEGWLDSLTIAGRRETTISGYRSIVALHLVPAIGAVQLQQLTALHLDRLYAQLASSGRRRNGVVLGGLSLRTVRYVHSVIGKALSDAERKGLVVRNVARLATPPGTAATKAPEMTVWSPGELARFLRLIDGHQHQTLYRLAALTGMRRGELCGLQWGDVDLDASTIRVVRSITAASHTVIEGDVKSRGSRRLIDVDVATVAMLRTHRAVQIEQRLLLGPAWHDRGMVFANPLSGMAWHPDSIGQAFGRLVATTDLPRIRFHDLRHTHATLLLAAGVQAKVVSERLGHASVGFTLDTYAHVLPGQQADAAAAVAALVDGTSTG